MQHYLEYSNHTGLRFHKLSKHGKIQHQCTRCDKTFNLKMNLKQHFKRIHGENLELFHCNFCKKSFKVKGDLTRHIENVHERVMLKCETCGKSLIGKNSLRRHVKHIHENIKYKKRTRITEETTGKINEHK